MKKITMILAGLMVSGVALAKDVGPDEAVRLKDSGAVMDYEKLNTIALNLHKGSKIESTELEIDPKSPSQNQYIYKVDLISADGVKYDVTLDALNGYVFENKKDD